MKAQHHILRSEIFTTCNPLFDCWRTVKSWMPSNMTHSLIFARFYRLLWCKITRGLTRYNSIFDYVCLTIISEKKRKKAKKKKGQLESFTLSSLLLYMKKKQTRFVETSDNDLKFCPGKQKKVNKICRQRAV